MASNSVKTFYLFFSKINEYIEESNGNKCLKLVSAVESKDILKKMKNYGVKSEILLDHQAVTWVIMVTKI